MKLPPTPGRPRPGRAEAEVGAECPTRRRGGLGRADRCPAPQRRGCRRRCPSPGLADAALADNENLQRGQHVLVHPVGAPGPARPRPTDAPYTGCGHTACACAPRRPFALAPSLPAPRMRRRCASRGERRKTPPAPSVDVCAERRELSWCLQRGGGGARWREGAYVRLCEALAFSFWCSRGVPLVSDLSSGERERPNCGPSVSAVGNRWKKKPD